MRPNRLLSYVGVSILILSLTFAVGVEQNWSVAVVLLLVGILTVLGSGLVEHYYNRL